MGNRQTGTPNVPATSINVVTAPLKQSSLRLPLSEDVQKQASLLSITMQHTIHLYCVMFDIKDSCLNHKSTTSAETAKLLRPDWTGDAAKKARKVAHATMMCIIHLRAVQTYAQTLIPHRCDTAERLKNMWLQLVQGICCVTAAC